MNAFLLEIWRGFLLFIKIAISFFAIFVLFFGVQFIAICMWVGFKQAGTPGLLDEIAVSAIALGLGISMFMMEVYSKTRNRLTFDTAMFTFLSVLLIAFSYAAYWAVYKAIEPTYLGLKPLLSVGCLEYIVSAAFMTFALGLVGLFGSLLFFILCYAVSDEEESH